MAIKAKWLSETGTWFAVATRWQRDYPSKEASAKGEALEHIKSNGRLNAVKAARDLREKYATEFDVTTEVEVEIMPIGTEMAPE